MTVALFFFFSFNQEAFHALHPGINVVQKYLKPFYIGDVATDEDHVDDDQALKADFEKLRQKAIAKVYCFNSKDASQLNM